VEPVRFVHDQSKLAGGVAMKLPEPANVLEKNERLIAPSSDS
jgi:hypothetical protein